jgi:hypothetical protein
MLKYNQQSDMKTEKKTYIAPEALEILLRPELNFCESSTDLQMGDTIFDEIEVIVPDIW